MSGARPSMASELALQLTAQAWCTKETEYRTMDPVLCEAFAVILDNWIESSAQFSKNADFYRGLLDECANHLGPDVYVSDDGSIQDEPLRLKIPEMVASLTIALTESVRLQSHYAALLNQYDGGNRKGFSSSEEWINRLKETGTIKLGK